MRRSLSSTCSSLRSRRVVVTGMGVVSPLAVGLKNSWKYLTEGKCGIRSLDGEGYEKLPCRISGLVPRGSAEGELDMDSHFSKSQLRTMSTSTAYALVASKEALSDASWKPTEETEREKTGVAVGVGMIDLIDVCNTNDDLKRGYSKVSPYFVPRILPNMAAGQISIRYGFRGPNHAVSTACATGAHAIGDAFRFVRHGDADVVVCGGAEACVSPLAIAAFCRLRALSTSRNDAPSEASRPFDKGRDGFVMGEGSAILVLEELEHALARNARIYAEILGYGLSGDAAHLTAPREDGSGAVLAMRRAIKDAGIGLNEVGYVNAHATSTPLGDAIEVKAVQSLFGEHIDNVMLSSTKGAHGHLLGAAGNLEAVFTVLAVDKGLVPPTINLHDTNFDSRINFVANYAREWETASRRIALKNAFGFGGTNASLCIAQYVYLDNISNNRSLKYAVCRGSELGNSSVFMRPETSQSSWGSRRWRNRSVCEDQLSLSKTRWPVPQSEVTFLPEFKIKETASKSEFEFVDVISKGAYGQVYKVRSRKGGEIFALKVLDKAQIIAEDAVERVKDEVHIQQVVGHHPFVVNASCHWQDKRKLYVGSSYVSGGELYTLVENYGSLPEDTVRILIAEVALAIDFLHNAGIIHRDIKASNVLLDSEGHAQLIDFGFAKWLSRGQKTRTLCGTPRYIAPEILRGEAYGHAVDWWSLGVLMFFLLTTEYPATPIESENLPVDGIESVSPLLLPDDAPISPTARDLVKRLLEPDPTLRLRSIIGLQRVGFYQNRDFRGYTCRTVSPLDYLPVTKERSTTNEGRGTSNTRGEPFAGFSDSSMLLDSV